MSPLQEFSTALAMPGRKVEYWNHAATVSFTPLVSDPLDPSTFAARMMRVAVGELIIAEVFSEPQTLRHLRDHVADTRVALFFLHLQIQGQTRVRQDGREALLKPGEFVLADTTRPYEQTLESASRRLIVGIPAALMRRHIERPEELAAVRRSGQAGTGALLARFLHDLWRQCLTGLEERSESYLTQALLSLVAGTFAGAADTVADIQAPADNHRARIRSYIDAHLGDPDLTPTHIAQACRMTSRYLHHLFSGEGQTVARYILRRRLDGCARALRNNAQSSRTVTAIAFDHGFNNPTHFGRVFRREYGMTPREYRHRT